MKAFVTGGSGYIGSNLVDRLLANNNEVIVYDNFSTGRRRFLESAEKSPKCRIICGDLLDTSALSCAIKGSDIVFHLAANADVRHGLENPSRDISQNTMATFNVLEAMRTNSVRKIVFSSTGSIYGEPEVFPTPECAPFPVQTSLYGASKLACEGLIQAYSEGYGFQSWIIRFVSILGERYTHGHIYDFVKQLRADSAHLRVLGDGQQKKSYLYVGDCIDGILRALSTSQNKVNILNLGTDEYCSVSDSIGWICERLGVSPQIELTGGKRGWIGDSPFILLDCNRVRSLGWKPTFSIRESVLRTVDYLLANPWVLEART